MTEDDGTFRVWIGCMACYNGGDLIGQHYDASEAGEVTSTQIHQKAGVLGNADGDTFYVFGDVNPHEEIWCYDIENAPPGYNREMSPMEAQQLSDVMEAAGDEAEAFSLWCKHTGESLLDAGLDDFRDHFHGHHASFRDYADELADEHMQQREIDDDDFLRVHFDWEHHARELRHYYFTEDAADGGVFVFSS